MGVITVAIVGCICKELAKLLVATVTDNKAGSAIAGELAGAAGKKLAEVILPSLVTAYVVPVEHHPEFRNMSVNDREAVRLEVVDTLKPALNPGFLGSTPYKAEALVDQLVARREHRGSPTGFSAGAVSMYRQVLEAAVRAIIMAAESATEWHAANAKEVHAKLDGLADVLEAVSNTQARILAVLDFAKQSFDDLNAKEYQNRRVFLEVYYRAICKALDRMELYGLDVQEDNPARSQRLSVAYISLNLTAKDPGEDEGSRSWESVLDALERGTNGRLLVRGDAGMGKTTLLRWAATAAASQIAPSHYTEFSTGTTNAGSVHSQGRRSALMQGAIPRYIGDTWRGKVPLFVILRECQDGKLPDPDKFPAFVSNLIGAPPAGFVRWLLDQGKALVMIDGLDEVPPGESMKNTSRGISDLLTVYGDRGNLFIATSRPLVKDPAWIAKLNFREAAIAPMNDDERDALIHKWHAAVASETPDDMRRAEIEAMPADLIHQLNSRPAVARLATVPLLCAMICAQSGPLGSKLPESEFAIINKLAEAMLWVRDRDRDVPKTGTPWDELKEDKRLAVAARLAHFLISEGRAAVSREAALQKIGDALRYAGLSAPDALRDAPAILSRMGDRGGVVRAPEGGLVEFAHKTFCEFLSAYQFVEDQDLLFLGEHAPEPGPSNVCRFTAGVKNRKYTEELIQRVLDGKGSPEARAVIALRMKLAAPTLDPAVQERVNKVEANMIPPHSEVEAKAIADLGDSIVPRLGYVRGVPVEQQIMNALTLSQLRSPKAAVAMAAYAPTADNLTLVELLCCAVNPMKIPLVHSALTEPDWDRRPGLTDTIRSQITDSAIKDWLATGSDLPSVTALFLADTQITDIGVAALASRETGLTALTTLDLDNTQVTDTGAAALASPETGLTALTTLDLDDTQVTDAGAAVLASPETGLKGLTTLGLADTKVTDAGAAKLAAAQTGLAALTTLDLDHTQLTDVGAAALASPQTGLKALTTLFLSRTQVTDVGAVAMASSATGLVALTTLYLRATRVTDEGAAAIKGAHPKLVVYC